jgi:hypothetical protein
MIALESTTAGRSTRKWHRAKRNGTAKERGGIMTSTRETGQAARTRSRRRHRQPVKRRRSLRFDLTDEEFEEVARRRNAPGWPGAPTRLR